MPHIQWTRLIRIHSLCRCPYSSVTFLLTRSLERAKLRLKFRALLVHAGFKGCTQVGHLLLVCIFSCCRVLAGSSSVGDSIITIFSQNSGLSHHPVQQRLHIILARFF